MTEIDWRTSPPHIVFLSTFLEPHERKVLLPTTVDWKPLIGENPEQVVTRFVRDGAIRPWSLHRLLAHRFKLPELKEMCRQRDLPVSGSKDEIIARLCQHDPIGMEAATVGLDRWELTDTGRKRVLEHWVDPEKTTAYVQRLKDEPVKREEFKKAVRYILLVVIAEQVVGNLATDLLKELYTRLLSPGEQLPPELLPTPTPAPTTTPTRLSPRVAIEWCSVPVGYFLMGSANSDPDAEKDEKPQHRLYLPTYAISKYPITNAQYRQFVQATDYRLPYLWEKSGYPQDKQDHPVTHLYWADAVAFCAWAARRTGQLIRLPTEAEWEKAARGTDGRRYPWGDGWLAGRCNNQDAGIKDTTPVGQYPLGVSPYGVHDMAGNVWEWTTTLWKGYAYPYRADDGRENPDAADKRHVVRGGSWYSNAKWVRAASRFHYWNNRGNGAGFRVVVAAPFSPASDL